MIARLGHNSLLFSRLASTSIGSGSADKHIDVVFWQVVSFASSTWTEFAFFRNPVELIDRSTP